MDKPKPKPRHTFRLLRSCLCFSVHKRDDKEEETQATEVEVDEPVISADHRPIDDDDDVSSSSATVSISPNHSHPPPPPPPLPEDIIVDVLARLPVKTLCRARCVCKSWRSLISSPAFAAAHAASGGATVPLVAGVFGPPRPVDKFRPSARAPSWFVADEPSLEVRVMDPADGGGAAVRVVRDVKSAKLMMSARLGRLAMVDHGERGARVMDPVTGRVMMLDGGPTSTTATAVMLYSSDDGRRRRTATDHDADSSNVDVCIRFYYNSMGRATPSGAYKVVRLRDGLAKDGRVVQICHVATVPWPWEEDEDGTSNAAVVMEQQEEEQPSAGGVATCCWRQRPEPPILTCCCSSCTAVVDGVLYFMNHRSSAHSGRTWDTPLNSSHSRVYIASFDLESEEWKPTTIGGPPVSKDARYHKQELTTLKDSLCLIQTPVGSRYSDNNSQGSCYTHIWFLVDPERSIWVQEYRIQRIEGWCLFKPLEILVDGRILTLNVFKKKEENLCDARCVLQLYHPTTGALTDLMEMDNDFRGPLTLYTGSLFS